MSYFSKLIEQTGVQTVRSESQPLWSQPVAETRAEPSLVVDEEVVASPPLGTARLEPVDTPITQEEPVKADPEIKRTEGSREKPLEIMVERPPVEGPRQEERIVLEKTGPMAPNKEIQMQPIHREVFHTAEPVPHPQPPPAEGVMKPKRSVPAQPKPFIQREIITRQGPAITKTESNPPMKPTPSSDETPAVFKEIVRENPVPAQPGEQIVETIRREPSVPAERVLERVREWVSQTPDPTESIIIPQATTSTVKEPEREVVVEKPLEMSQVQLSIGAINLKVVAEPKTQPVRSKPQPKPQRPAPTDTRLSRCYLR